MINQEQIEQLLSRPADERRLLLQLLQESLVGEREIQSARNGDTSAAAKWLLSVAGRYSGRSGDIAGHADEILRAEINKESGLTTK